MIRPMRLYDDIEVRAIHALCHPSFPAPPTRWFEAHPTLVAIERDEVVGYTSYSVVIQPALCAEGEAMVGYGIDIRPGFQGHGYGRQLFDARLNVARAVGAKVFVGHTWPGNTAMIHLFDRCGFKPHGEPTTYPDGQPMQLYFGRIV